jgi:hypothetical protein
MKATLLSLVLVLSVVQLTAPNVRADQLPFPEVPRPAECTRYIPNQDEVREWVVQHKTAVKSATPPIDARFAPIPAGTQVDQNTEAKLAATLRDWTACNNAASNFAIFAFATDSLLISEGWPSVAYSGDIDATLERAAQTQAFLAKQFEGPGDFSVAYAIWNVFGGRQLKDGRVGVFVLWGPLMAQNGKEYDRLDHIDFVTFVTQENQFLADEVVNVGSGCSGVAMQAAQSHLGDICQ